MKIRPVRADMTNLIVAFRKFANAPIFLPCIAFQKMFDSLIPFVIQVPINSTKAFLTSALDVGEWSTSRLVCFIPGNGSRYAFGKWVDPRAYLDVL
jgi:hypothetical protein